jgi:hypothetical protein
VGIQQFRQGLTAIADDRYTKHHQAEGEAVEGGTPKPPFHLMHPLVSRPIYPGAPDRDTAKSNPT